MIARAFLASFGVLAVTFPAFAQHDRPIPGPYAGFEQRSIKALSLQQIEDLRAGRGMGLALAAELNAYPGPLHVIELAQPLALTDQQRARVGELFDAMKAETIPIGERLIEQEAELDHLFASGAITLERLMKATDAIGSTSASLRATHLKYHLVVRGLLSADQIRHYAVLRGYTGMDGAHQPRH